jgi:hypothetical protein
MAKAVDNAITVKLSAALERVAESYGAAEGKRRILERLKSGEQHAFGFRKHSSELALIPVEFWQDKPVDHPIDYGGLPYRHVYIDWAEGSAWREDGDEAYYGIRLAEEDSRKHRPPVGNSDGNVCAPAKQPEPNKPKSGGRKLAQAMELLKEMFPPHGLPPDSVSTEWISQEARVKCEERGDPAPGKRDTFARARHELTRK